MILVFVGAGGSAAVNPEQYPTTVEFFNRLPDYIEQEPLFIQIREFLETSKRGQPIDIEEILWNLMCVPFEIASFLQLEFLRGRFATTG